MKRKIKALGMALAATLALTAVMASTAQSYFTSSAWHTVYSGSQVEAHKITAGAGIGAINCSTATFSGTAYGTTEEKLWLTPTYAGCKDSLGRTVDIVKNTFNYEAWMSVFGVASTYGELVMTVTTSFGHCTITIKGGQTLNGFTFTNEGGNVKVTTHTNNITSSIAGGGFACGTSATHSSTGTYTGTTLIKGNGGAAAISVD